MKRYYKGRVYIDTVKGGTPKAICVTVDSGRWCANNRDKHLWIARSLCDISEPNECGWCEIIVPAWIFQRERIDYLRIEEITWTGCFAK